MGECVVVGKHNSQLTLSLLLLQRVCVVDSESTFHATCKAAYKSSTGAFTHACGQHVNAHMHNHTQESDNPCTYVHRHTL